MLVTSITTSIMVQGAHPNWQSYIDKCQTKSKNVPRSHMIISISYLRFDRRVLLTIVILARSPWCLAKMPIGANGTVVSRYHSSILVRQTVAFRSLRAIDWHFGYAPSSVSYVVFVYPTLTFVQHGPLSMSLVGSRN